MPQPADAPRSARSPSAPLRCDGCGLTDPGEDLRPGHLHHCGGTWRPSSLSVPSGPSGARAGGEPVLCGVCLGRPLASGRPCICGGVGTEQAEMHGLRVRCFELEDEVAALRASQGGDGGAADVKASPVTAEDLMLLRGCAAEYEDSAIACNTPGLYTFRERRARTARRLRALVNRLSPPSASPTPPETLQ